MPIPIGLQLYSVREDAAKDLGAVLSAVAKMGYAGVEFAGYHGRTAGELRRMLDDNGLKCCGTHIRLGTLLGEELAATVDFNREIGNKFLVVPGLEAERRSSVAAWKDTARVFNDVAEKLKPHGMRTGYHNHMVEFQPMEGQRPWDVFLAETGPDVVMQLDTGNALHGGADPVGILEERPGRAATVHLKEYSSTKEKPLIGEGDVRWAEVFKLAETVGGTEWYIVEQESYRYPPMECAARCLQSLRGMGK